MVSIDYRLYYGITKGQIFDLFKSIGYFYLGPKKKAVKKGDRWIPSEEFIKILENGRYHIFLEFSSKSSGTEAYPQIDIHAHFDIFKKKGDKNIHITRRNVIKDLDELYNIHGALKENNYGHIEYKSVNSAHETLRKRYKQQLLTILQEDYVYDEDGKYKKKIPNEQITFQIIEQHRYLHLVCVYAIGEKHDLHREKALIELNLIMEKVYNLINEIIKIKTKRDQKNLMTKGLITLIKQIDREILKCKNSNQKRRLINKKKRIEKKLINSKKIANNYHKEYIKLKIFAGKKGTK